RSELRYRTHSGSSYFSRTRAMRHGRETDGPGLTVTIIDKSRLQAARVLVVGDAMLDRYLFGNVDRISPEAPVPVVRVTRQEERLGGAANAARNARALGSSVTLITVVGQDEAGKRLRQLLEGETIRAVLGSDASLDTCVKLRVIGRAQQLVRVDFET